jgi:hypothetical protein
MAPLFCSAAAPKIKRAFSRVIPHAPPGSVTIPVGTRRKLTVLRGKGVGLFAHTGAQSLLFGQKTLQRVAAGGTDTVSLDPPVAVQCDPVFQRQCLS